MEEFEIPIPDGPPHLEDTFQAVRDGDYEAALHELWKWSEIGDADARFVLGVLFLVGAPGTTLEEGERNLADACIWIKTAAKAGQPDARACLVQLEGWGLADFIRDCPTIDS